MLSNEVLRKVQLKELEILLEIKRICETNDINYCLCFGTLLGAVRHKGFIPWDDDIDIYMKREDYERFIEIASSQISEDFFVESSKSNPLYTQSFCKVRANNTVFKEKRLTNLKVHHGIWVDVFPLDNLQNLDFAVIDKHVRKMAIWQTAVDYHAGILKLEKPRSKIFFGLLSKLYKSKLLIKKEKEMQWGNSKTNEYVVDYNLASSKYKKSIFPKEYFEDIIQIEFEGHKFSAPSKYDAILRQIYGDYMELPPVENRNSGHDIIEVEV